MTIEFNSIFEFIKTYVVRNRVKDKKVYIDITKIKIDVDKRLTIKKSLYISKKSDGAFDISFSGIGKLWSFKSKKFKVPNEMELKKLLPLVNYKNIILDEQKQTAFLKVKGMKIGLGAIAKGYAVDKAKEVLIRHGIKNFFIDGGGDIYFSGKKKTGPWKVGITDPGKKEEYFAKIEVENKAVVTSGDYERFIIVDNKRYHHIINPQTGMPAYKTLSTTIISDSTFDADGFSTAVFIMGYKKGMNLIESIDGIDSIIIDKNSLLHISTGLKNPLQIKRSPTKRSN